jgi:hypothetical protein
MGNYETTVMRRKYKKSRVCAKQNGSVFGYNDASKKLRSMIRFSLLSMKLNHSFSQRIGEMK